MSKASVVAQAAWSEFERQARRENLTQDEYIDACDELESAAQAAGWAVAEDMSKGVTD